VRREHRRRPDRPDRDLLEESVQDAGEHRLTVVEVVEATVPVERLEKRARLRRVAAGRAEHGGAEEDAVRLQHCGDVLDGLRLPLRGTWEAMDHEVEGC